MPPATRSHSASHNLLSHLPGNGIAYGMGGDEFCVLLSLSERELKLSIESTAAALSEHGEGFSIGCSYGAALVPSETADAQSAQRLADQRMCAQKRGGRVSASRHDVLLRVLSKRNPDRSTHGRDVATLAAATPQCSRCRSSSSNPSARPPSSTTSARSRSPTRSSRSPHR